MAEIIHLCDVHKERGIKCVHCSTRSQKWLSEMMRDGYLPPAFKPEDYDEKD
jgi:hypothetical protein